MQAVKDVYALFRPDCEMPFYIGASSRLKFRVHRHTQRFGFRPEVVLLASSDDWQFIEKNYITYFRELGASLENIAPGGHGNFIGHRHSRKSCLKMSASAKRRGGRAHSNESRAKIAQAIRNKWREPGQREKQSASMKGIKHGS